MKLIEADRAKETAGTLFNDPILKMAVNAVVDNVPGFDLVRCKDCKHYMTIHCTCDGCCISDDWYCADGERRTDG